MRKRPNSKSLKGKLGKFAEPMWVWEKTKMRLFYLNYFFA